MHRILSFVLLVSLFACEKNTYIIPQAEMVDILVDIHLTDGLITANPNSFRYDEVKLPAYKEVYKKYNIDNARLDSSLAYYSRVPDVYVEIYDSVITRLMIIETNVQIGTYYQPNLLKIDTLINNNFPEDSLLKDSVFNELWHLNRTFSFDEFEREDVPEFNIEIDTVLGSLYVLKTNVHLHYKDSSELLNMVLNVAYRDSSEEHVGMLLIADSAVHSYRLQLELDSGKMPKSISGHLLNYTDSLDNQRVIINDIRLYELGDPVSIEHMRYKGLIYRSDD